METLVSAYSKEIVVSKAPRLSLDELWESCPCRSETW